MSIILDTFYDITEIQANYYDKVATDSLFSNIYLSNYYSKIEVDDTDNTFGSVVEKSAYNEEGDYYDIPWWDTDFLEPPPAPPRTKWTRRVPRPLLTGRSPPCRPRGDA